MKVALVHDWLTGMRGGEKVLEALIDRWPQSDIFTLFYEPGRVSAKIRNRRVQASVLQRLPGARHFYRQLLPLFPWAIRRFDLRDYDLVISISHCVAKSAIAASSARHLCYCLSPMRYLWSHFDQYRDSAQTGFAARMGMRLFREPLRAWDRATAARAGQFIAISTTIARRIEDAYGRCAPVIYPPVDTGFFTPGGDSCAGGYWLAVSAAVPYKRLDLVIEACNQLGQPLKVAGGGPGVEQLRAMAGGTVEVLGWVSDEELRDLYRHCRALIFPPEEDFGIAPVEAQACGRPVLAFGRGGALETVIEGETGAFFAEQSAGSLMAAMEAFSAEDYDPVRLRAQAERFGPRRFGSQFTEAVERFLEAGPDAVKSSNVWTRSNPR